VIKIAEEKAFIKVRAPYLIIISILIVSILAITIVVIWTLRNVSNLKKFIDDIKSKIDVMSKPAETLTQITTALQKNISDLSQSITNISTQATKIEMLGEKYEETENLTRRIYNIMIGSYEKGKSGENYLRNMLNVLMKIGIVRENVPIGSNVVEYCVVFSDGKLLPIDSKMVATKEVEALYDEKTSEEDREELKKNIRNALKKKIEEVSQYINPQYTLPCAVMVIPDSLVDLSSEIIPDAVRKNILIVGHSAVPQLIAYFVRIHGFYAIKKDIAELRDRMIKIQQEISKLDDNFFANKFERPLNTLNNAILQIRQVITTINSVLSVEELGKNS